MCKIIFIQVHDYLVLTFCIVQEQKRMQKEYHKKIEVLESERNGLEDNKAQVGYMEFP